jgi:hypothetical protein
MLSILTQCIGFVVVAVFAFLSRKTILSCIVAVVVMTLVNIISQIVIAKGGPGAFVGTFVMPVLGILITIFVVVIKKIFTVIS